MFQMRRGLFEVYDFYSVIGMSLNQACLLFKIRIKMLKDYSDLKIFQQRSFGPNMELAL